MTKDQEAAAMHGIATNRAFPVEDRLQAALQALEFYTALSGVVTALRDMADKIDRGPTFRVPPSVISALVRERADQIEREATDG